MKILLLKTIFNEIGEKQYKFEWEEVNIQKSFNGNENVFNTEYSEKISSRHIYGIKNDIRRRKGDYVICNNCNKIMKKEEFEKHCDEVESQNMCLNCDKLRYITNQTLNQKITDRNFETGEAKMQTIEKVNMVCKNTYFSSKINSEFDRKRNCKFYFCRQRGCSSLTKDYFVEHPMPFKKIVTERALIENGWLKTSNRTLRYKNTNLYVSINDASIVEYFWYEGKSTSIKFRYADNYGAFLKMNEWDCGMYEISSDRLFPKSYENKLKTEIEKLYK